MGGHFAFLALERACGGKAVDGLAFLNTGDDYDYDGHGDERILERAGRLDGDL